MSGASPRLIGGGDAVELLQPGVHGQRRGGRNCEAFPQTAAERNQTGEGLGNHGTGILFVQIQIFTIIQNITKNT